MTWNLDSQRPIYVQLVERIQYDIVSGHFHPGDRLPSVRDFASEAGVNPNTMQKALAELERSGLVSTQCTAGRFITDDPSVITGLRNTLAKQHVQVFIEKMRKLGCGRDEILELIDIVFEEAAHGHSFGM